MLLLLWIHLVSKEARSRIYYKLTYIIGIIEEKREEVIMKILLNIRILWESLCKRAICPEGCTSILLGSLTRQMYGANISPANTKLDASGFSVNRLHKVVSAFDSPPLRSPSFGSCRECYSRPLEDEVKTFLERSLEVLEGPWLDYVWSRRVKDMEARKASLSTSRTAWRINDAP